MMEATPMASPMVASCKATKSDSELLPDPSLYRSVVGALQFATITRP